MYFPYLYGRKAELLALRAMLSDHRPLSALVPVIEPVNAATGDIVRFLQAFGEASQPAVVVVNPDKHQLSTLEAAKSWRAAVHPVFKAHPCLIPGYRVHAGSTKSKVDAFFKLYAGSKSALVFSSSGLSDAETATIVSRSDVKYNIILNGKMTAAQVALVPKAKRVDIRDEFNKLDRNADYGPPELFTDRHKTFTGTGIGFGDYASVGAGFRSGGTTPHAVAIHATYRRPSNKDIWIEHFVSDDKDKDASDVATKYLQAAAKLVSAARRRPAEFGSNFALSKYAAHTKAATYRGLPKSKELQISHHLCLMLDVLSGKV